MAGLVDEQWEFLKDVALLITFCDQYGFVVTGGELFRTPEQQAIYYKDGRSKTMASNHLRRLAIDLNFFWKGAMVMSLDALEPVGSYWESLHPKNRWGGNFKSLPDGPHFERNV